MFKLGVISDEISQDFSHALNVAEELGLKYIELRTIWGKNIVDLSDEEVAIVKKEIDSREMQISCLASPFLKSSLEGEQKEESIYYKRGGYEEQVALLRKSINLAHIFGTDFVRAFSFWKKAKPFWEREDVNKIWDRIIENFSEPLHIAKEEGIILVLENEPACNVATSREIQRLFTQLSSPSLGLLWDPANAFFAGENTPFPVGYQKIKNYIKHVHAKDAAWDKKDNAPHCLPVGKGSIDYHGQFKALLEDDFTGIVSLETHFVPESGGKEEGTRISFLGMKRILTDLEYFKNQSLS